MVTVSLPSISKAKEFGEESYNQNFVSKTFKKLFFIINLVSKANTKGLFYVKIKIQLRVSLRSINHKNVLKLHYISRIIIL